jgi:hypothetical protein
MAGIAINGWAHSSRLHTTMILHLTQDLPIIIEIVDAGAEIEAQFGRSAQFESPFAWATGRSSRRRADDERAARLTSKTREPDNARKTGRGTRRPADMRWRSIDEA